MDELPASRDISVTRMGGWTIFHGWRRQRTTSASPKCRAGMHSGPDSPIPNCAFRRLFERRAGDYWIAIRRGLSASALGNLMRNTPWFSSAEIFSASMLPS